MALNRKGTKRKSESPPLEEGDVKKYWTRSSSRNKSVSYKEEVSNSETKEVPQKAESGPDSNFEGDSSSCSIRKEEKVPEVDSSSNESSKKKGSPYFSLVPVARNGRNAAATKNGKVKKNSTKLAVAGASLKQVFKPVNLDQVDMQAEVNLSGSDSEDNSRSSSDDDFQKPINKKKSHSKPKTAAEEVDKEESSENAVSEQQEDAALDAWSSNLEALNNCQPAKASTSNDTTEVAPTVPSAIIKANGKSSRQPKGSKTKTEKKKPSPSKRGAMKAGGERLPSNVAELLKAEKNDQELITPMRYGKVVIFALTLSALFRWFKTTKDTSNIQYKMIKALVGEQERQTVAKTHNNPPPSLKVVLNARHHLCPHNKQGCLKYSSQALIMKFVYGWGLHASLSLIMSLSKVIRKPSKLLTLLLSNSQHVKFGAFLASMAGIYRACHCALRWIRGRNSSTHSLAAGLAAGVRIGFYPNTSLFLYITWKTIETLYHQGVDEECETDDDYE